MARERKHFDIDIRDLTEEYVDACARVHAECFPDKLETLLGLECLRDCLRRRYMKPQGDCFCRIAVSKSDGRLAGYVYAEPMRAVVSNSFLNRPIARAHLLRRIWLRPRLWLYVVRRVYRSLFRKTWNEGLTLHGRPDWEVAKMLGIHPDFRGGNVGVELMLAHERDARARGMTRVCGLIERTNVKAARLYQSIGWVYTSPDWQKYDVFAMHKDLTPAP